MISIVGLSSACAEAKRPANATPARKSFIIVFIVPPLENALFAGRLLSLG